jgi:hypothetical protein
MSRPAVEVATSSAPWPADSSSVSAPAFPGWSTRSCPSIERCRTAALGRHRDRCSKCGEDLGFWFNPCLMGSIFLWEVGGRDKSMPNRRVVKIFKCIEESRSFMMDVEDKHNHIGRGFWPT